MKFKLPADYEEVATSLISTEYMKHWGEWEAYRELQQNSIDATKKRAIREWSKLESGRWLLHLYDEGDGASIREMLVLGESRKDSTDAIGQYGEGAKVASIIMLRSGYRFIVRSRDWEIMPIFDEHKSLGKVLTYYYTTGLPEVKGVHYYIIGLNPKQIEDWDNSRFLYAITEETKIVVNHESGAIIKDDRFNGNIFKKGIWVQKAPTTTPWTYNVRKVDTGRDRNFADPKQLKNNIGVLLSHIVNKEDVSTVFEQMKKNSLESEAVGFYGNSIYEIMFYEKYGKNAVISDDGEMRDKVRYHGGKLVVFKSSEFVWGLERGCSIRSAHRYIREMDKKLYNKNKTPLNKIKEAKKNKVHMAWNLAYRTGLFTTTWKRAVEDELIFFFTKKDGEDTRAYTEDGKVYIASYLTSDVPTLAGIIGHELIHKEYGYSDCSSQFQQMLQKFTNELCKILFKYISPRSLLVDED